MRSQARSMIARIFSVGLSPTSRGFETIQVGGGFWSGRSGAISVPEWKATSS